MRKNIKLPETTELFHIIHTPNQPPEHPDHWDIEVIGYLLEPDLDHPSMSKYFTDTPKEKSRSTKPSINPGPANISTHIGLQDFIKCFKHWKELTTSFLSGCYIGHYKGIIGEPDIVAYFCKILRLPICHGFAPMRWEKNLQTISKDEGQTKANRLRNILLLEADYNFTLKLI